MNRLASESSAYLKSAAHQPVHWRPWGEEAFAAARADDKPILLDIGAVWCHWCHVMDGESYEDPAVAEILNRQFVCVKVDRDERPDVDARYQRAVQALTGQGGWPLTAFLTPQGEVFFGGTYFPPEDNRFGRPGFVSVLRQVAEAFHGDRDKVAKNAAAIRQHVTESLDEARAGNVSPRLVEQAADQMARLFDIRYGGFGTAPKFPHAGACEFLLSRWWDTRLDWPREVVEKTLDGMACGGIRDHLGGGFHRYSVDERWIVPHFEKMSYDNSELLRAYCSAFQAWGSDRYREVATGIVDWVLAVLADRKHGTFFTSQDADVAFGDDGDYWTWTPDEARAALDAPEFAVVRSVFDVEDAGEMDHNPRKNVLWRRREPATAEHVVLDAAIGKLKAARDRRRAPAVDTTAYVSWNAMMAGAFLHAGAVLDRRVQHPRAPRAGADLERGVAGTERHGPRAGPRRAARHARRQRAERGRIPRCLRSHRRRAVAGPQRPRDGVVRGSAPRRRGRRLLRPVPGPGRRRVPRHARQAGAGRADPVAQRGRGARARPPLGAHR